MATAHRFKLNKIVRFMGSTALDLFLPDIIDKPLAICRNFYHYFCVTTLRERVEIFRGLDEISPEDEHVLHEAILAEWCEQVGVTTLPSGARTLICRMLESLRHARSAAKEGADASEALRDSLNQVILRDGNTVPQAKFSRQQRQVGQLLVTSLLSEPAKPQLANDFEFPTLDGYEFLRVLGSGGFGVVYLARHRDTSELRAVKVGTLNEPRRFREEIALACKLDSPHLARYLEHGETGDRYRIAMEYLGELTLADLMRQATFRQQTSLIFPLVPVSQI